MASVAASSSIIRSVTPHAFAIFKIDLHHSALQGNGDFLSYLSDVINEQKNVSVGSMLQADAAAVTNVADVTSATNEFSSYDNERDLDCPAEGFSSIPEAIEDIRQGKFVIVVDDDRENEGDLIMAASKVTPDAMAFIKREKLVELASIARLPLKWGNVKAYCYRSLLDGMEHIAMVKGDIGDGQNILVRVHSECLTEDIFGSARCDCGNQLALVMELIEKVGQGVLVYLLGNEGRSIGLGHNLRAYNLQDAGHDTVEAKEELGLSVDSREYGIGARILQDLGVRTMRLLTNNPAKYVALKVYGLSMVGRVPLLTPITKDT